MASRKPTRAERIAYPYAVLRQLVWLCTDPAAPMYVAAVQGYTLHLLLTLRAAAGEPNRAWVDGYNRWVRRVWGLDDDAG